MGRVTVVVGGLFGSEAKGSACGFLAHTDHQAGQPHVAVRVGGSQAGHTVWDAEDREWKLRHVPVAAAVNPNAKLVIAAGSEIDLDVLADEITQLEAAGHLVRHRLWVHPSATVITQEHKDTEAAANLTARLGSTAKGVGAARAARMMRTAPLFGDWTIEGQGGASDQTSVYDALGIVPLPDLYLDLWLSGGAHVVIEGVQGYGLGLHTEFYPFTTSSDARAIDFLAMAGLSPWQTNISELRVLIVFRTRPIRVAGNSGPLKGESSWADLGLPEERTTVTKNVRRVAGEWDQALAEAAVRANGGIGNPRVFAYVSMLDQINPECAGASWAQIRNSVTRGDAAVPFVENARKTLCDVALVSTGPRLQHVSVASERWV